MDDDFIQPARSHKEAQWALGRRTDRTYLNRSFFLGGAKYGSPARYLVKVFDETGEQTRPQDTAADLDWTEDVVETSRGRRRSQLKILIAREAGQVEKVAIERVTTSRGESTLENVLTLDRGGAARFIELVQNLKFIPAEGGRTERIDDETLRAFYANPEAVARLYERDADTFRELIRNDPSADDLVALARRRAVIRRFRQLLSDPEAFEKARAEAGGKEKVWQQLLEKNPWILGISLAGQLLQSWDDTKLEQVVAGSSIAGPGKRADAVLRTSGRIRSLVFAEIKHHETELLDGKEYRSGCWPRSSELVAGVTQAQQTVDRAVSAIGKRFADIDEGGAETGEATWLIRPRSFLIWAVWTSFEGPAGCTATSTSPSSSIAATCTSPRSSPSTSSSLEPSGTSTQPNRETVPSSTRNRRGTNRSQGRAGSRPGEHRSCGGPPPLKKARSTGR